VPVIIPTRRDAKYVLRRTQNTTTTDNHHAVFRTEKMMGAMKRSHSKREG
jgi:hypothetical protein